MAVDWLAIRNDYINGFGSYRKLAEQYGVPFGTLRCRAEREEWVKLKEAQLHEIGIKTAQQTADAISEKEVNRIKRLLNISDQMIDRIEQAVRELDQAHVTLKEKTKTGECKDENAPGKPTKEIVQEDEKILAVTSIVDRKGLQQVATALKAVWEITGEAEAVNDGDLEDDGLLAVLGANAQALFNDGDDSDMLPKEKEE